MPPIGPKYRLVLMHPMDPRGSKLGGIETHVRQVLARHPDDFSVLFVGIDEFGDGALGAVRHVEIGGRRIEFLPVAHIDQTRINLPGKTLSQSTTFRFACGILRHHAAIRRAIGREPATADLQRFEFAGPARLLGLAAIQMVHGEGAKDQTMDSLIKRFWFIHRSNEWLALNLARKIHCVNANIIRRLETVQPAVVPKTEVMTVSVDTDLFAPRPFPAWDGTFKIVFAGRLDSFKDPPLMFRILAGLKARLLGRLEFHYVGTTDPSRYPDYEAIADITVRHGFQPADAVARIVAQCHAGILTSFFEGMPCYLLETLSVGRAFAAIRLPQYDPLVVPYISGTLVERSEPTADCEAALVEAFVRLRNDAAAGRIDPLRIHALVEPYSVRVQMQRLFAQHRALQDRMRGSRPRTIGAAQSVGS